MSFARTDAAAVLNAPAGLFGADVLCGGPNGNAGHRETPRSRQTRPEPTKRVPSRAQASPIARPAAPEPLRAAAPAATGGAARLWAAYAMGRALSA